MASRTAGKIYGTVSAEKQKALSGLDFVQGLADGSLPLNTIAKTLGYDVTAAASGRVTVTAVPNGAHLNPAGTVHGGLAATLLDSAMGLAVQTTLEKGAGQTTLEFKISLVRPITPETARADGRNFHIAQTELRSRHCLSLFTLRAVDSPPRRSTSARRFAPIQRAQPRISGHDVSGPCL
jgi:uncharacterized protein (TIGR00369 family)